MEYGIELNSEPQEQPFCISSMGNVSFFWRANLSRLCLLMIISCSVLLQNYEVPSWDLGRRRGREGSEKSEVMPLSC